MLKKDIPSEVLKQYEEMKAKHPDAILIFGGQDCYFALAESAMAIMEALKCVYVPEDFFWFPRHRLDSILPKLTRAGKRIAICEQLENPALKLVKRDLINTDRNDG